MPALRVNDAEAHALAREIAALTGRSLAEAVIDALRRRRDALLDHTGPDPELVRRLVEQDRRQSERVDASRHGRADHH